MRLAKLCARSGRAPLESVPVRVATIMATSPDSSSQNVSGFAEIAETSDSLEIFRSAKNSAAESSESRIGALTDMKRPTDCMSRNNSAAFCWSVLLPENSRVSGAIVTIKSRLHLIMYSGEAVRRSDCQRQLPQLSSFDCEAPRSMLASESARTRFEAPIRGNRHRRRSTELVRRAGSSRLRSWLVKRRTDRCRPNLRSILWFAIWTRSGPDLKLRSRVAAICARLYTRVSSPTCSRTFSGSVAGGGSQICQV